MNTSPDRDRIGCFEKIGDEYRNLQHLIKCKHDAQLSRVVCTWQGTKSFSQGLTTTEYARSAQQAEESLKIRMEQASYCTTTIWMLGQAAKEKQ